jgi:DNA uptake protein ComE-like DNA-binding protein
MSAWRPPAWKQALWTRNQRSVLAVLILILCACFAVRLIQQPLTIPRQPPAEGPRAGELLTQLDLNSATVAQLSAIPHLGGVKVAAIVAYRDQFTSAHPGQRAFDHFEALYRIKGIGPSAVKLLREYTYIDTPTAAPATAPTDAPD